MWVFCKDVGFLSIVQHDEKPDHLMVRARRREHLVGTFPGRLDIEETPDADYRWRITVPRVAVIDLLTDAVVDLDYTSHVKEVVAGKDDDLYDAIVQCWSALLHYQQLDER